MPVNTQELMKSYEALQIKSEQQAKSIDELVEALEDACDFALMSDHECPEDIQPKISGLMDLANIHKTNKQDK